MQKFFMSLLAFGASLLLSAQESHRSTASHEVTVAVFSINDFHGGLLQDLRSQTPGAAAVVQTLDSLKACYPAHITVSAGDNFGGSFFYAATRRRSLLPQMFADMGIRLSVLGNHEFDDGQEELALKWSKTELYPYGWGITYLGANVRTTNGALPSYAQPWAVEEAQLPNGRKIPVAFVGLTTSNTPWQASARRLKGLSFDGNYNAVLDSLATLPGYEAVAKAPIRLLLTHIGTDMKQGRVIWDDRDNENLRALQRHDFHGILSAHSHVAVCGQSESVVPLPIVQGFWHGNFVSVLECRVDTLRGVLTGVTPKLVRVNPHIRLSAKAARLAAQIQEQYETTLFRGFPLNAVLTECRADLSIDRKQNQEQTEVGSLVCQSYATAAQSQLPTSEQAYVVGVSHFGSLRAGFTQGKVTVLDVGEVLPFANPLHAFRFTGRQLRALMDFGVRRCKLGRVQTSGVLVKQDAKGQIRQLQLRLSSGKLLPIKDDTRLIVVADEYMTTGGDEYPTELFTPAQRLSLPLPTSTDAFIRYLQKQSAI